MLFGVFVALPRHWDGFPYTSHKWFFAVPIVIIGGLIVLLYGSRHRASVLLVVPLLVAITLIEPRLINWAITPKTETVYVAGTSDAVPVMGTQILYGRVVCYDVTGSVAVPSAIAQETGPTWDNVARCVSTSSDISHSLRIALLVSFGLVAAFLAYLTVGTA